MLLAVLAGDHGRARTRLPPPNSRNRSTAGAVTAEAIVRAHLDRIDERDADVLAWSHLARDAALRTRQGARSRTTQGPAARHPDGREGHHRFATTSRRPTARRSTRRTSRWPMPPPSRWPRDAGAILLGKTVTTEFANRHPGADAATRTIPPIRRAARRRARRRRVADFQVCWRTGTQTGGSVIRPAAFCGIVGYKPSYGHFPPAGMKANTEWLDTIGAYARSVEDIALFRAALMAIPFTADRQARPRRRASPSASRIIGRALARRHQGRERCGGGARQGRRAGAGDRAARAGARHDRGPEDAVAPSTGRAPSRRGATLPDLLSESLKKDKLEAGAKIDYATWVAARKLGETGRAAVDALFADIDVILTAPARARRRSGSNGPAMPPSTCSGPISGCPA